MLTDKQTQTHLWTHGNGNTHRINELINTKAHKYGALTVLCLKVGKTKLRALVGDQELSVQGENHGFVLHVDHAANHVSLFPRMSKVAAACMQTSTLYKHEETNLKLPV